MTTSSTGCGLRLDAETKLKIVKANDDDNNNNNSEFKK